MYFYEVFVAEARYQKAEPLTYSSRQSLDVGEIVTVPYGNRTVNGFVAAKVSRPDFATKSIIDVKEIPNLPKAIMKLHEWIIDYYASSSGAASQMFVPSKLSTQKNTDTKTSKKDLANLPPLTSQQQVAIDTIEKSESKTFLLHGETGSGKTRIYLERANKHLGLGKSVIILTPEISLVPQLVDFFDTNVNAKVIEIHSGLTASKRSKNWLEALETKEPIVIIGTRSAIFAPLKNVGFIAIDEMHEPAYKQDSAPRYNALRVAAKRAKLQNAEIIYGSATPPILEYYLAKETGVPILRLSKTAKATEKISRRMIDIKDTKQFSKHRYISDNLLQSIETRLARKEQSLLFLNRRGTARQILCQKCGWQAMCPKCDLPLTLHADKHQVRCHTCGYFATPPYQCPDCSSNDIVFRSLGTKALVSDLEKLFPEARIQRFDTDNLASETLSRNFGSVQSGEIDILVGTQMLGKGLDLPKLSLVGVINADTSLHMPDFSSAERSYQLLHQAIGRVGRGHSAGEVIIQTFQPKDRLIQAAINQNWHDLYEYELEERKQFIFPPFCYLASITVSRKSSQAAEDYIYKLHRTILGKRLKIDAQEPTPSFYERSHGKYNWQIILKARRRELLTSLARSLPTGDYTYDIDPINLL